MCKTTDTTDPQLSAVGFLGAGMMATAIMVGSFFEFGGNDLSFVVVLVDFRRKIPFFFDSKRSVRLVDNRLLTALFLFNCTGWFD